MEKQDKIVIWMFIILILGVIVADLFGFLETPSYAERECYKYQSWQKYNGYSASEKTIEECRSLGVKLENY